MVINTISEQMKCDWKIDIFDLIYSMEILDNLVLSLLLKNKKNRFDIN